MLCVGENQAEAKKRGNRRNEKGLWKDISEVSMNDNV